MINSKELVQYTQHLSILFVEDNEELRQTTAEILRNFFEKVDTASNGEEALVYFNKYRYDIVLTDIRMPRINGVSLIEEIYKLQSDQVIMVLSAHDESQYLFPLINLGIEQFIKKPIDFQDLLEAFYKAAKKIAPNKENGIDDVIVLAKGCEYDRSTRSLTYNAQSIYLTKFELIFMQLMTKYPGKVYSNEDIVEFYFTNGETMDLQNIRKLVSKLRKKLPKDILESIYGVGYKLAIDPLR